MTPRFLNTLALFSVLALVSSSTVVAQNVSTYYIEVRNNLNPPDTFALYFANAVGASYDKDSLAPNYYEYEPPPSPPGLQVSFALFRGAAPYGGYPIDVRGIPPDALQRDTFDIKVDHTETAGQFANYTFLWPNAAYTRAHCDSMFLIPRSAGLTDTNGNPIPNRLDMTTVNRLDLLQPIQISEPFKFRIIKYGVKFVENLNAETLPPLIFDAVREEGGQVPLRFTLQQNYPNPFNPSTTIRFDIPKKSFINISVFNLLGQEVARLASEELLAGSYSTKWNGKTQQGQSAGSGVYFVRMSAVTTDRNRDVYSSVRKIVLSR